MSNNVIKGRAYVVGEDIDTDVIIPARYLNTMDPAVLRQHAMEGLDPETNPISFLDKKGVCDYGIIVAGKNFGCGSSREHAPIALSAAGIQAVVAPSFARIYYRNSVNGGIILPLESTEDLTHRVKTGDEIEIQLAGNPILQIDKVVSGLGRPYSLKPFDRPVQDIIEGGGLTAYNKTRLGL